MRDKVLSFIREHDLLHKGDSVIVALSGGADSVSLLHVLLSMRELYDLNISAAHFNHMIRGEEADRDERFCRELCGRLGVTLHTAREDVPAIAAMSGESLELCGRRFRYEALERAAGELGGAKIATAHNLSDNTETVLMNLVRGSGIAGLSGIPPVRGNIIRPLLSCSREEIEAYCAENGLSYVTDSTNLDDEYTRNKLRLNILPLLRELNPSLDEGVQRMASVMRDADGYLDKISVEELKRCKTEYGYICAELLKLDKAVLTYAVKNVVEEAEAPLDSLHIGLIIDAMRTGGSVDLGKGRRAVCAQGILRITGGGEADDSGFCVPIGDFCTRVSMDELLASHGTGDSKKINKKFLLNCIPCDIITDDTAVRHRRAGDVFTDPRRGVTKTLKKLFNEIKIPREERDNLIVIADGSTVLWIQGTGTSKQAQIPEGYSGDVYVVG